jgi:hypothetical protein
MGIINIMRYILLVQRLFMAMFNIL